MATVEQKRQAIQDVLALKRGAVAPALNISLPVEILCDVDHCVAISERLKNIKSTWERVPAISGIGENLPDSAGLYMFVWVPDFSFVLASDEKSHNFNHVIYIGKTGGNGSQNTLRSRYNSEYRKYVDGSPAALWDIDEKKSRDILLQKYLTLYPLEYWYLEFSNDEKNEIDNLEGLLLKIIHPPCNLQKSKIRLTKGPACPAF
jgi:hypothetical protein